MKAIAMVAHPDDCIIFAYSFMHAHPDLDWTVCYLTYEADDYRGSELKTFWDRRGIATQFLGYVDDWHDIENKKISFDQARAWIDIQEAISGHDIVLTHDADGDYGHLHHVFVHQAVADWHPNMVTFAGIGKGTVRYTIPNGTYDIAELPNHGSVIASFHSKEHANEYFFTDAVKKLLNIS
jgi:LmbE family N-acetylglucosaminyl deacetylase